MSAQKRKKRVPKLAYTEARGIGYHVSYRDSATGNPRKFKFGTVPKDEAERMYYEWVAAHLRGETPSLDQLKESSKSDKQSATPNRKPVSVSISPGCLLEISSGFLVYEESRVRPDTAPRTQNTITRKQYNTRKQFVEEFGEFLNSRKGDGAVGKMKLSDLKMQDVEAFNRMLAESYSDSAVRKRMQVVKAIIDRAGRPEHGEQLLKWNWESRDIYHGRPEEKIVFPTLVQLKAVLKKCDNERAAMVWLAIGCGFGQRDLAALRVGDIDAKSYDLRRGKTGIDRWGETPKLVWSCIRNHLSETPRANGELMFLTQRKNPLVHGNSDSVQLWWARLRESLGKVGEKLNGFYSLRHLGATEFGNRPGCSIGAMRGWLGHSASSAVADRYMKPVSPQTRPVVEWVRKALQSEKVSLG